MADIPARFETCKPEPRTHSNGRAHPPGGPECLQPRGFRKPLGSRVLLQTQVFAPARVIARAHARGTKRHGGQASPTFLQFEGR